MYPQAPQPYPQQPAGYPQPPQAYPPQQYAPPAAPQYAQPAQPQYAPPAPAPAAPPMPSMDEFRSPPAAGSNIARPRLMDLAAGRLVLFRPTKVERDIPDLDPREAANGKKHDTVTTDIIPLDGAPYWYGGKPEKGIPHTTLGNPGDVHLGVWISNKVMVAQLERSVDSNARLMVLGRLTQVQGANLTNNPSWRLSDPTEADRAIAREWKRRYDAGEIAASAAVAAPAQQPAPQYAPVPQSAPPAAAPMQPQYAPPQPPQYAPPQPTAAAPVQLQCPPNIDPAWFYAQSPDAQAYYVQQAQPTAMPAAPQPGQPANWS